MKCIYTWGGGVASKNRKAISAELRQFSIEKSWLFSGFSSPPQVYIFKTYLIDARLATGSMAVIYPPFSEVK